MTSTSNNQRDSLKVAIVGSGPSGFYAAEALARSGRDPEIDMFERLPAPYGLVRNGVAPDHPKLKQPIQLYARIAASPAFRLFGNVTVGRDIPVDALRSLYHAVIFTCGAESDRRLQVPGEELPGIHSAREFVGWYNGHPDFRDRTFDLDHETAVVFGQGNVASDVARILAKTHDELKHTDIAAHALDVLAASRVRDIYVVGRRGPAQAKFTPRELREFGELDTCAPVVDEAELALNACSESELADRRNTGAQRVFELFRDFSARGASADAPRRVHFTFLKSPVEFSGHDRLEKLRLEINRLTGEPFAQRAQGTGRTVEWEAGIAFCSIGYRGTPIPGLPFDADRGVIPNRDGRVVAAEGVVPGVYVSGWIKRGPTGIIGTNRADSAATVQALLEDFSDSEPLCRKEGRRGLTPLLSGNRVRHISFDDWQKIDTREIERGSAGGKPREKFTCVHEMLAVLDGAEPND